MFDGSSILNCLFSIHIDQTSIFCGGGIVSCNVNPCEPRLLVSFSQLLSQKTRKLSGHFASDFLID